MAVALPIPNLLVPDSDGYKSYRCITYKVHWVNCQRVEDLGKEAPASQNRLETLVRTIYPCKGDHLATEGERESRPSDSCALTLVMKGEGGLRQCDSYALALSMEEERGLRPCDSYTPALSMEEEGGCRRCDSYTANLSMEEGGECGRYDS